MTETSLLTKYRPTTFKEVVGQEAVVRSLAGAIKARSSHAFLFVWPSGTGKTTLARIAAAELGCKPFDLEEVDAASKTGIDDMREICAGLAFRPLGEGSIKAVIVDECHALSKAAVTSLLKITEDPPEHVYWFFCTTEINKVPAAMKTRCLMYQLKPVPSRQLADFLAVIADEEKLEIDDTAIAVCAKEAQGSPRQALSNLAVCALAKTGEEAAELLQSASGSTAAIDLARALYGNKGWAEVHGIISTLGEVSPESVRHVIRAYGTTILTKSGAKANVAGPLLEILDAFSEPFNSGDGLTPLYIACGKVILLPPT
jgi:DNA polymerase-3 subunit gamma/tau